MAKKEKENFNITEVFNLYKSNCRNRNIFWELTKEDLSELVLKNCYYCGVKPSNKRRDTVYSGLDRKDHNKGYTKVNVLPCCKECNGLRSNVFSVEETKAMVEGLLKFRLSQTK